jgi:glycosyltransferase involved in cell wall biosynthesis
MPNVVLEAMAAGLPVVATEVEGIDDLIRNGETGRVVPPGSPGELAEAICAMLYDPALARRIAQESQAEVKSQFTLDRIPEHYESLYHLVLSKSGRRVPR